MSLVKDAFIAAHESLIEEMLERNPHLTWDQAYDLCGDAAYGRMQDRLADIADNLRQRAKDERL